MFGVNSAFPMRLVNNFNAAGATAARSIERLSSGLRINRAGDDPSGLTMSTQLRSMIASLQQSERNAEVAIALSQTAESGLEQIGDIVLRLKEIAIQAADDTLSDTDLSAIQTESQELIDEVDRIANAVTFNGTSLLAAAGTFNFFVGDGTSGVSATIPLSLPASQSTQFIAGVTSASIATTSNDDAIASLDLGVTSVALQRSGIGAVQNRLSIAASEISSRVIALESADSAIRDADLAQESMNLVRAHILAQTSVFAIAQANLLSANVLALFS